MPVQENIELPIEVSARHVHLAQADQDVLFGPGYQMKIKKNLSQTGQWAAEEKVTVIGPKGQCDCRVLGPCRPQTQVEFAFSDGFKMGIDVPLRESGHLDGTPGCTLVGPKGRVELKQGVIDPQRHLHIRDTEAAERGLEKGDILSVIIPGPQGAVFNNFIVRVHPTFRMNIHLDTDEGNACSLPAFGAMGRVVRVERAGKVIWTDSTWLL